MSTFTNNNVASGDVVRASDHNTQGANIASVVNGNIEADNLASNAVTTAKIADASITNAKLNTAAGELGGAWQDWTPTYTSFSLDNGTVVAKYVQQGKTVHFSITITLGSGSTVSSNMRISLPVTANDNINSSTPIALGRMLDSSASTSVMATLEWESTTTMQVVALTADAAYIGVAGTHADIPFTWATNDTMQFTGTYEAA